MSDAHPKSVVLRAFEDLENQVRYGVKQKALAAQTEAWKATIERRAAPEKEETTRTTPITQQAITNPRETFKQLSKSTKKTPQDYFVLAVLSDLVTPKQADAFFLSFYH